jgi:ABC-2 type transport system permease protein
MSALLRAELLKLRTTRTFIALTGVALGTSLLLTTLVAVLTEPSAEDVLVDVFTADTSSLFILLLAVVGITGEWRHRTITSSLLAAPNRLRFLAAKTMAFAAAGIVMSVLISITIVIVGVTILSIRDLPVPDAGELIAQVGRNSIQAPLLGALGVGIGALLRNQVVAIVGVLVVSFAVEPTVLGLAPDVGRFGPFIALPSAAADISSSDAGFGDAEFLAPGLAVLAMLAWIGTFFAAGAALLRARDLD